MSRQFSRFLIGGLLILPGCFVWSQLPPERQRVEDLKQQDRQMRQVEMDRHQRLAGRFQTDPALKAEYEQLFRDTDRMLKLTEELKAELGKNDPSILSITSIKRSEEIEKLAKKVRSRLRRWY
jgi:transposase